MRATRSGRTGLDPVARLPRRQTVVRAAAAALLLSIAAAVAWHGPDHPGTPATAPPPGSAGPTPPLTTSPAALSAPGPVPSPGAAAPPLAPSATGATGGSRLAVPAGMVGVPVPLGTPAATAMLEPGDRVDLLALVDTAPPVTVAEACPVLDVDRMEAALMLALTPAQAEQVLAAPASTRFAVIVRSAPVTSGR